MESTFFGLDVDVERVDDDTTIVRATGELDLSTSSVMETELQHLIHEGIGRRLYLDLSQLTFLDSTGLRALWRTRQHAQAAGTQLFISGASDSVMRVLQVTKLDRVFRLLDDGTRPQN